MELHPNCSGRQKTNEPKIISQVKQANNHLSMNITLKKLQQTQLNKELELISTIVLNQFNLTEELINGQSHDDIYTKIAENKNKIDNLKVLITKKLSTMIILFTPKAVELREIISCHETILSLEQIDNLLVDIVNYLKKSDLNPPEYIGFKPHLKKIFASLKIIISASAFSFFRKDKSQAYQIIEKEYDIEKTSQEIYETIIAGFQEIPLSGQEIVNIIHLQAITYILEKIKDNAINIAKSTIFAIEGIDYKYQNLENKQIL
jgi:phosphate transport system protein